jgi:hypothetical protein
MAPTAPRSSTTSTSRGAEGAAPNKPPVYIVRELAPKKFGEALAIQVAKYRKRYESGERVAALFAFEACINSGYVPNPVADIWMRQGLHDIVMALHAGADGNEALGLVPVKGKHVESNRKKKQNALAIMFRIYQLHHGEGKPLDDRTFTRVGDEVGYSCRTIRRIFDANPWAQRWLSHKEGQIVLEPEPKPEPKSKRKPNPKPKRKSVRQKI